MDDKPYRVCFSSDQTADRRRIFSSVQGGHTKRLRGGAALLLALLCLLPGCGKKDNSEKPVELPTEYAFGDEMISALSTGEEENVQFAQAKTVTYLYNGLTESGNTVSAYVSQLISDGFTVVDEELVKTVRPDFTTEEGTIHLAKDIVPEESEEDSEEKDSEEETDDAEDGDSEDSEDSKDGEEQDGSIENDDGTTDMVILIILNWSEGACSVTIDEQEGKIIIPETPETAPASSMTLTDAVAYLNNLSPAVLGLSGDSMEEYHVYAQEGAVLVDGYACVRLNVYTTNNSAHTNEFVGSFLMTSDGRHLYRSNAVEGTIEEVDLP